MDAKIQPAESVYSVRGVSRRYGDLAALDNVSLEITRGEWVSIVGPSGSGKSTLMNILGCMDTPTDGVVLLEGDRLDKMGEPELANVRRHKIGLVFQQFHLVKHLNAVENVMLAQYYHSIPDEQEAMAALERVGMADRATHLPSELSGGEQQRVGIARAVVNKPAVLLADEPTGNLDDALSEGILRLFEEFNRVGVTVLMATHDMGLISRRSYRMLTLSDGHLHGGHGE